MRLDEVVRPTRTKVDPRTLPKLPFVGMEHVEAHSTHLLGTVPAGTMRSAGVHFHPGDVLYGRLRPYLNKVHLASFEGVSSAEFIVLSGNRVVDAAFLKHRLNSADFVEFASHLNEGDRPRVDWEQVGCFEVPLPPLAEQRRIVAALEEHLSDLEAAVAGLERAKGNTTRYVAAVLDCVTTGQSKSAASWSEVALGSIADIVTGTTPPTAEQANYGGELPFFKPTDLAAGYNVRDAREHLSATGARYARRLPARSVLVTCIGATIGKTGLTRVECATNQQINAVVVDRERVMPEWMFWYFRSPRGQAAIKDNASATTLPILNKSKFSALKVAVPSLEAQRTLVDEIERHVGAADRAAAEIAIQLARASRLRQSILKRAFEGKLVPQDPSDEPASALLERIRADRASPHAKPRRATTTVR